MHDDCGHDSLISDGSTVWSGNSTATYMGQPSSANYCTLLSDNSGLQLALFTGCANGFMLTAQKRKFHNVFKNSMNLVMCTQVLYVRVPSTVS